MQHSWLNDFETKLDQLERASTGADVVFADMYNHATAALKCLGTIHDVSIWLARPNGVEELRPDGQSPAPSEVMQAEITAAIEEAFVLTESASATSPSRNLLTVSAGLADVVSCVLRVTFDELDAPQQTFIEGTRAIVDVVGGWVSRQLMSRYEHLLTAQTEIVNFVRCLSLSSTVRVAASVMAQDGPAILGRCRIAVLSRRGERYRIEAVTGVRTPNVEAETMRAIEDVVNKSCLAQSTSATSEWRQLDQIDDTDIASAVAVLRQSDVAAIRLESLTGLTDELTNAQSLTQNSPSHEGGKLVAAPVMISVEAFANTERPNEQLLRQLLAAAGPVFARLHERQRTLLDSIIHGGKIRWLAVAGVLLAVLSICPADFEIEAPGQIVSTNQRRLFAPEHGTIDQVRFQNEDVVQAGQLLLKLSNPDLDLEHRRVQGDIDTTTARLAAVHATRLSGGDPQLSGEETQLNQQLQNLKEQKVLIEQQLASLEITAPFAGTVFRRDSQQELMSRPVQRGQLLLEIVPADSDWQLEISIPDDRMSYVTNARHQSADYLPIRYVVRSAPERNWTTSLSHVDNAVEVHDGEMSCRATALLTTLPQAELRPGTTVTARIVCGRRSLGFVMFREVIEFWRQVRFAWF